MEQIVTLFVYNCIILYVLYKYAYISTTIILDNGITHLKGEETFLGGNTIMVP